jgi:hypothetical protein
VSLEALFTTGKALKGAVGLPQNPRPHPFLPAEEEGALEATGVLLQSPSSSVSITRSVGSGGRDSWAGALFESPMLFSAMTEYQMRSD